MKFNDDKTVRGLRGVMMGAMLFSVLATLLGQPASFWHRPETAMRGDGLTLHDPTNHTFEFFLGHGWAAYLAACVVYVTLVWLIVSLLPRRVALIAALAVIFGHYYGASNWLAVRWHLGVRGPIFYSALLGTAVVWRAFPPSDALGPVVRRLRWLMLGVMLADLGNTLLGQPGSFWSHPETMNEANHLVRIFLGRGWLSYFVFDLVYSAGAVVVASVLPNRVGLIWVFAFIFSGFAGGSNWLFYRWRLGMESPVIYGVVLSAMVVWLAFPVRLGGGEKERGERERERK